MLEKDLPETATLVITGEGTVNATGGNAGNGGDGADGLVGSLQTKNNGQYTKGTGKGSSGVGGLGGVGGGGAGAGIGGSGGFGGSGGNGGVSREVSSYVHYFDFCGNGNAGTEGTLGGSGKAMGACYVIGPTIVVACSGNNGISGGSGGVADWIYEAKGYYSVGFATCGGGGGGGGGAGSSPCYAIGGGGASGGGGGGGGSGALTAAYYLQLGIRNAHGGGGGGGHSPIGDGSSAKEKDSTWGGTNQNYSQYYGGDGGTGGAAGAEGGAGALYVSPIATVNVEREKLSATTHPAVQYTITFNSNGGQFSSSVESLTATLGCELPDCIPTPTRSGYLFDGWMMISGEEYYDASGTKSISSYPMACDVILYAKWHLDDYYTAMTPEPVPYTYFSVNYPSILSEHGDDYEAAAKATAANGRNKVWECYVAGISPTNETAKFAAKIEMKDGAPVVTWEPNLNTNGTVRIYKVYGSETLENGGDWQYPTNSLHKFFKVTVEMP